MGCRIYQHSQLETKNIEHVDAEIWSPFARPDRSTNAYMINEEDVALCLLQQLFKLLGLKSPFFFSLTLRSQKQIRDVGGFAGVNPPILKLAQGVYEKTCMICVVQISCNIFNTKYLKDLDIRISDNNLAKFPLYPQFLYSLLHRSLGFL